MTAELALLFVLQWTHVLFGVMWFGSQLYANLVLWPEMRKLPREHHDALLADLPRPAHDALRRDVPHLARGRLYMVGSILTRGYGGRAPWWAFNAGFLVLFTLMIAMRFGL